jgi:phosphatidylserine/phosphatidylglycerophosphate/cardiolipin synthase-like enzyme
VIFSKNSGSFSGGGDDEIIKTIQEANSSIFLAMYDFTNDKIKDALIDAKDRGVDVEIVTDDSKVDDEDYQDLKNGDIPIFDDNNSNALMHNKFMIIDQRMLWSGSANYTYYSFYRNSENIILIKDKKVAKTYLEEFKELKNHTFVKNPYISECVEVYFSPEDHFETKLIDLINQAKESVEFLIFAFTNKEIADALIRAKKRGLRIRGVFDEKQNEYQKYSKYNYLLENGLDVKLYGGNFKLHDKVMIIDKKIVVTGSYNFTVQADEKNSENSLVIYKKELANKYEKEFQRIYENAN